ncbi:MAG: CHAT domain-containing protein [Ferruginibacter sp.]
MKKLQRYFLKADTRFFESATRHNFVKHFTKYKIIQLYTHASDTAGFGEPVIYFADSLLLLSELIGGEQPATNLIVLSACNTGAGKLHPGEGVFSFNREFASMGVPAAITNLWEADRSSGIQLTELFYEYLNNGVSTHVALQQAKLAFLSTASEKNKLPYFWAGTILTGKSNMIAFKKPFPWPTIILIIAGISLVVIFAYLNKRKKI